MRVVRVSSFFMTQTYNWYIARCFHKKSLAGEIKLIITEDRYEKDLIDKPWIGNHVHVIFIDERPIIIDTRDTSKFPMDVFKQFTDSKIIKFQYSSELYNNPPNDYEDKISEEEVNIIDKVYPFAGGRSMTLGFDSDELSEWKNNILSISKKIVSYTGEGIFKKRTLRRLDVYDLVSESVDNSNLDLIFYHRLHYSKENHDDKYLEKIKKYQNLELGINYDSQKLWQNYKDYISWLSRGEFSINIPGIACSQPFRLIDSVFANRKVITTKIYNDAYKDFPCIQIPFDGYFQNGDFDESKKIIQNCKFEDVDFQDVLKWYEKNLSVNGIWNQIEKIINN